jgi:hypothetical protein
VTPEEARAAVGLKVVYRAPHVRADQPGEEGVLVSVNDRGAFVRYGADPGAKLTPFELLEPISGKHLREPFSATHYLCDATKAPTGATHHFVPGAGSRMVCRYCKRTERQVRQEMGLER